MITKNVYEHIIIGAGTAGKLIAKKLASAGKTVAVIEERQPGGTCPLRGCIPKKILHHTAQHLAQHQKLHQKKIMTLEPHLDWNALITEKDATIKDTPRQVKKDLEEAGATLIKGKARFASSDKISVGEEILQATKNIIVATGTKPRKMNIEGEEHILTSEELLATKKMPQQIIFVGGGMISFEFAHIMSRAGANTVILHRSKNPLENFDKNLVKQIIVKGGQSGVLVHLNKDVVTIRRTSRKKDDGSYQYLVSTKDGHTYKADAVVHGAGRTLDAEGLNLKAGEIKLNKGKIATDKNLRSISNPKVIAAGDAADHPYPYTPVAKEHARIITHNILHTEEKTTTDYTSVCQVVFTIPPLARVGILEPEKEQHQSLRTNRSEWFSTQSELADIGGWHIIIDKNTDTIVGAHVLGPKAEEFINLFAMAIRHKITVSELSKGMYAYPSVGYDLGFLQNNS